MYVKSCGVSSSTTSIVSLLLFGSKFCLTYFVIWFQVMSHLLCYLVLDSVSLTLLFGSRFCLTYFVIWFQILSHLLCYLVPGSPSASTKKASVETLKKRKKKKQRLKGGEDEAGEETDEGDMESREVDYMSDLSSSSEMEYQVSVKP